LKEPGGFIPRDKVKINVEGAITKTVGDGIVRGSNAINVISSQVHQRKNLMIG
jgi:hypothetical protein